MAVTLKTASDDNAIVIASTATSEAKCDRAYFELGIEGHEPTREACLDRQEQAVREVCEALGCLGLSSAEVRTGNVELDATFKGLFSKHDTDRYTFINPGEIFEVFEKEWLFDGYNYDFNVFFEIPFDGDSDQVECVWRALSTVSKDGYVSVRFDIEDTTDLDKQLRIKALEASRAEAEEIARALGMRIVRASHVDFELTYEERCEADRRYLDEASAKPACRARGLGHKMPVFNPKPLSFTKPCTPAGSWSSRGVIRSLTELRRIEMPSGNE